MHFKLQLKWRLNNDFCREQSLLRIEHKEKCLENLPYHHKQWLQKYKEDLDEIKKCITKNSDFIPLVLCQAHCIFGNVYKDEQTSHSEQEVGTLSEGLDKVSFAFWNAGCFKVVLHYCEMWQNMYKEISKV